MDTQDPAVTGGANGAKRPRNVWRFIAIATLVEILFLGGGGVAAYALHSSAYTPESAVTDYFAAQSRGDSGAMMANATFQKGSNPEFFDQPAIAAMMGVPQNKDLHNVNVVGSRAINPTTQSVAVSMTWAGHQRNQTYEVRKDNSQFRDLIYRSWRIVIPFVTLHITLPNQPGPIQVDGITPATSDVTYIQAVEGYHQVAMGANFLYDNTSQIADGVDDAPSATLAPDISSGAVTLAAASVKLAFPNCDASQSIGCINHTYNAPNGGQRYFLPLPGYGNVLYTTYRVALVGDPTSGMKLVVPTEAGKADASGTCTVTLTINGTQTYNLAGPWTGTLTWENGRFTADLVSDCWATKA